MEKNYKYLIILISILNFTNIYSQSNNYVYTWYNESIGTLYIDKQLLESTASMLSQYFSALSQYLGPLAPIILKNLPYIIENLPIIASFLALFFIFYRFLNIINEKLNIIDEHPKTIIGIFSLGISLVAAYLFWPFVIPILGTAFIIKIFRIGKSKLESFKESLGKINPGLINFFSKATTNIRDFDKDTGKVLKDINKIDKIINHPRIRELLNSIEKDIETLNNIISHLLKETENEKLTPYKLIAYSSKFDLTYKNAINKIEQLNRTINTMLNPYLLRRVGNTIFRTNKFTPKYLRELINISKDLNGRLNNTYNEGYKIFEGLKGFLISAEATSREYKIKINNNLNRILNNRNFLPLFNNNKSMTRKLQEIENTVVAIDKNQNIPPLKKVEILSEILNFTKNLSKYLRKFKGNPKKLSNFINKNFKKIINSTGSDLKTSKKR